MTDNLRALLRDLDTWPTYVTPDVHTDPGYIVTTVSKGQVAAALRAILAANRNLHCLRYMGSVDHRMVTITQGAQTLVLACECGREFYRDETWPVTLAERPTATREDT